MLVEVLLFLFIVLVYFVIKDRKHPKMPPGPFEIPFFGQMPIFDEEPIADLTKRFGKIITVRTGNLRTVLLVDYKIAKEVMGRIEFTGRPSFFTEFSLDEQKTGGLVSSNGKQWQHDRRFVLKNLRDLGMGRSYLEEAINTEAKALVEDLKKYNGEPINYPDSFRTAVLNIIWQMVASTRYDLRSKEVESIYNATKEFQSQSPWMLLPTFVPALKLMPGPVRNIIFKENLVEDFLKDMEILVSKSIVEHEKDFNIDNPRDLIDEYLKEMKEEELSGSDHDPLFRKGALLQIISDLFAAGSDTVNNMLKWVAYLLARYPDVTARMQKQVDEAVPRDQMVSLEDKPRLPLIEAFTVEALRFSSMVVLNVQRTAITDTTIQGYFIPKDTIVTVCNYSIHNDPHYWDEPEKFNPDRFIDENGKFHSPREAFFAFGSGRRQCLGELLARMELFLFSAAIIQNLDVKVPDDVTLRDEVENRLGLRIPFDEKLIYMPRT